MAQVLLDRDDCQDEGDLPPVCVVCGAHAEEYRRPSFAWHPPWVLILILAGVLVWAIVAMILTKRMSPCLPVCHEHANYFRNRKIFFGVAVFLAFVMLLGGCGVMSAFMGPGNNDLGLFIFLGSVGFFILFLIVAAVYQRLGIRPTEITDYEIQLTNVSESFVEAVRDQRRKARARRRRGDDDDDE